MKQTDNQNSTSFCLLQGRNRKPKQAKGKRVKGKHEHELYYK